MTNLVIPAANQTIRPVATLVSARVGSRWTGSFLEVAARGIQVDRAGIQQLVIDRHGTDSRSTPVFKRRAYRDEIVAEGNRVAGHVTGTCIRNLVALIAPNTVGSPEGENAPRAAVVRDSPRLAGSGPRPSQIGAPTMRVSARKPIMYPNTSAP